MSTPATAATVSVRLPVIFCATSGCGRQLVTHICTILGTDGLLCIFCARDRAKAGLGHTVAPVYPASGWGGMGFAPPLDAVDGIALLVRRGGVLIG